MLLLVTAQWGFPLQQPMKCYCIIIHLLRPIRTYQQRKKFNLNSPLGGKEWPRHEIKAGSSVLQWFATPRHNRVRERDIPALSGFPDPGEKGWRWGPPRRLVWGKASGGGCVKYTQEFQEARLLLPRGFRGFSREAQTADQLSHCPPFPATGTEGQWCPWI